jgi:uncharacterized membrane protein YbhN (UPF0104 family)
MRSAKSQRFILGAAGLLGSALFVGLAMRRLDFASVLATWRDARPMPWLLFAVIAYSAGHFVRGQRLRVLVRRDAILHLSTATNVVVVGYASNNVLPARLGEFVRAGMLAERTGMPLSQSLTITLIERLLDGVAILGLLVVGTLSLGIHAGWIWSVARLGALVFGAALAGLFVAIAFPGAVLSVASRLSARLGPKSRDRALSLATGVTTAGASLRRPRDAMAIGGYSVIVWLLEALMFACVLPVFGMKLALASSLVTMSVTNLGILVPSSPGFIGSFHFFCAQALMSQGVPGATAMGYALVVHLAFFVPVTLWGAGAILWYGIQVGATAALAQAAKALPRPATVDGIPMNVIARLEASPASTRAPSAFERSLTETFVASDPMPPDPAAIDAAATFLAEQIDALPGRLRFLYSVGMAVFRVWVRVTQRRSFCVLSVDRRRAVLYPWAFGRITHLRQLFRPVRSTVLLAYYEGERVARTVAPLATIHLPPTLDRHEARRGHG